MRISVRKSKKLIKFKFQKHYLNVNWDIDGLNLVIVDKESIDEVNNTLLIFQGIAIGVWFFVFVIVFEKNIDFDEISICFYWFYRKMERKFCKFHFDKIWGGPIFQNAKNWKFQKKKSIKINQQFCKFLLNFFQKSSNLQFSSPPFIPNPLF